MDWHRIQTRLKEANGDPVQVTGFLNELAAQLTVPASGGDASDEFLPAQELIADLFHLLPQYPLASGIALSRWLNATGAELAVGKQFARFLSLQFLHLRAYPAVALRDVPANVLKLTGCRLCALFTSPAVVVGYCLAILELDVPEEVKLGAVGIPLNYLAAQLPASLTRVLDYYFSDASRAAHAPQVIIDLRERLNAQQLAARARPHLNEFNLSREQQAIFTAYRRHMGRDILKRAEEKSVFAQFATQRHFKYATHVSFELRGPHGNAEQDMRMQEFGGWVELPLVEHLDPQMADFQRTLLWNGRDK